jgi:hypothetical protein
MYSPRGSGSAAGAGLCPKGSHSTYQPLVLGLLDLVGEDVAVGAHEIEGTPQSYDVSWLCRLSVSITYPTPNCRASSAGSVVGLWQA